MSYYRDQLEKWLKQINVSADSVLDVGGGENPIKNRVASWNVKKYRILDNEAQFRPDIFGDLNYLIDIDAPYDVLFCLEVFEYVWNPVQAIENLSDFLKPGGTAYISFPTIYPLHNPPGMDYMRYTKNGVEKLMARGNFNWEITPRVASLGRADLAQFYHNEQMHPMKGTAEIFDIGYLVKGVKI